MVEQRPVTASVRGSSPCLPAKFKLGRFRPFGQGVSGRETSQPRLSPNHYMRVEVLHTFYKAPPLSLVTPKRAVLPGKRVISTGHYIMNNKVKLRKGQLDYFRKLARKSPLEIQAYLVGEVVTPNLTVVDAFVYTSEYGLQTRDQAAWYRRDYEQVREQAEERGRRIVGSIHSHPESDAVVSPSDYEACIAEGHRICGIVSTDRANPQVRFWVMDCALPADVMYVTKKATPKRSKPYHSRRATKP